MANGRCYHHGGKSLSGIASPTFIHGRHSKDLPTRLSAQYEASRNDPDLLNLSEEIALADSLIEDARRGLDHGESGRLFRELKAAWDAYMQAQRDKDATGVQVAMADIGGLIRQGVGAYAARGETMELVERRRRLVDSEHKRRVAMQDMVTSDQAMMLVVRLTDAVMRHVNDPKLLSAISAEFGTIITRNDPASS